jgi:hypothetical protein
MIFTCDGNFIQEVKFNNDTMDEESSSDLFDNYKGFSDEEKADNKDNYHDEAIHNKKK